MPSIHDITTLIETHGNLAGPLCLIIAFLGCTLGSNLVIPAGAILTSVGVLIGAELVPWIVLPWTICGAIAGMTGSYLAGRLVGPRVRRTRVLQSRPHLVAKAEALFARYGFASVLVAYFSGPLRAPVATVAGIAGMNWVAFQFANVTSAPIWTLAAVGAGAAAGRVISPNSIWLIIAPILVPAVTVGLSVVVPLILRLRKTRHGRT
jgi:membrane protein DedA with SNARE-associated domain